MHYANWTGDLPLCLHSGQVFNWKKESNGKNELETGVIKGNPVVFHQQGNKIFFQGASRERVWEFLRLGDDFRKIREEICREPVVERAFLSSPRLRLLKQEPWECSVSFILSSFCNIPRIDKMLFSLRREFGEPLGNGLFSFPNAEILAGVSEKRFRQLGLGYRAGFVKDFSERVCKGEINFGKLQKMKTLDACEALLECKGIGGKVADCILLYGLGKLDVFPVDVWIARIMQKEFGKEMKGKSGEKIRGFAVDRFGNYSGYAQLYLFAMSRKSRGI